MYGKCTEVLNYVFYIFATPFCGTKRWLCLSTATILYHRTEQQIYRSCLNLMQNISKFCKYPEHQTAVHITHCCYLKQRAADSCKSFDMNSVAQTPGIQSDTKQPGHPLKRIYKPMVFESRSSLVLAGDPGRDGMVARLASL